VTPLLSEAGSFVAKFVESQADDVSKGTEGFNIEDPVLVCGFGDVGQAVANIFELLDTSYVAFDLTVPRVIAAQEAGFNVLYGDATRPKVLHAAGIETPKSIAVCYAARQRSVSAVASLRSAFPDVPIMARAIDLKHASELEAAGADEVILSEAEAGLSLGARLSLGLGWDPNLILPVTQAMRGDMEQRSHELAGLLAGEASESHESSTKGEGSSSMQGIYTFKDRAGYFERDSGDDDEAGGIFANISGVLKNAIGSSDEDGSDDNAEKELAVQSRDDQVTTGE